jgi:hypothetical protein
MLHASLAVMLFIVASRLNPSALIVSAPLAFRAICRSSRSPWVELEVAVEYVNVEREDVVDEPVDKLDETWQKDLQRSTPKLSLPHQCDRDNADKIPFAS